MKFKNLDQSEAPDPTTWQLCTVTEMLDPTHNTQTFGREKCSNTPLNFGLLFWTL